MWPAMLFPDTEAWATDYLRPLLAARPESWASTAAVDRKVTNAARLVVVRRDGGPRITITTEVARLGVRVFGTTQAEATDLANLVRALLADAGNARPTPVVHAGESAGPIAVDDPSGRPLRYFVAELIMRGEPLT